MENYQKEVPEKVKNFGKEVPTATYQGYETVTDDQLKPHQTYKKDSFELTIKRQYLEINLPQLGRIHMYYKTSHTE